MTSYSLNDENEELEKNDNTDFYVSEYNSSIEPLVIPCWYTSDLTCIPDRILKKLKKIGTPITGDFSTIRGAAQGKASLNEAKEGAWEDCKRQFIEQYNVAIDTTINKPMMDNVIQNFYHDVNPENNSWDSYILCYVDTAIVNKKWEEIRRNENIRINETKKIILFYDDLSVKCLKENDFKGAIENLHKEWVTSQKLSDKNSIEVKAIPEKINIMLKSMNIIKEPEGDTIYFSYGKKEYPINKLGIYTKNKNEKEWSKIIWVKNGYMTREELDFVDSIRIEYKYWWEDPDYARSFKALKGDTLKLSEEVKDISNLITIFDRDIIELKETIGSIDKNNGDWVIADSVTLNALNEIKGIKFYVANKIEGYLKIIRINDEDDLDIIFPEPHSKKDNSVIKAGSEIELPRNKPLGDLFIHPIKSGDYIKSDFGKRKYKYVAIATLKKTEYDNMKGIKGLMTFLNDQNYENNILFLKYFEVKL